MSLLGNGRLQGRRLSPHRCQTGDSGDQHNGHEPPTMSAEKGSNDDEHDDVGADTSGGRPRPTPQPNGDRGGATPPGEVPQGTATSRMAASLASPMPETLSRSSMVAKGPRASR